MDYIVAFLLLIGGHELGHQIKADNIEAQIRWEKQSFYIYSENKNDVRRIQLAGFEAQDMLAQSTNNNKMKEASIAHKLSYLAYNRGDLYDTNAKTFIALSAILAVASDKVAFGVSDTGTPLLLYRTVF